MEDTKIITMPVIALRGLTMLPEMTISFDISRKKSIAAVEKAMVSDQRVCLVAQKDPEIQDPSLEQLYHIGTVSYIKQLVKMPGGIVRVMAEGQERAELLDLDSTEPALIGEVLLTSEQEADVDGAAAEAMSRILKEKLESYGRQHPKFSKEILPGLMVCEDLETLMLQMASELPWDYRIRQSYLEEATLAGQYEVLLTNLIHEIEVSQIHRELQEKVKENIDKNQKDYILREQMKVIREELGEDLLSDTDEYEKQLALFKSIVGNNRFKYIHCDNSAAMMFHHSDYGNLTRIGIAMYGVDPRGEENSDLKQAMSLYTKVAMVKVVPKGEKIGYGMTYTADEDQYIATLPIGYADGFTRANQGREVYINGHYYPVVGRVCMDQCMVKVDENVKPGDDVEIFGEHISLAKMAKEINTIPYEIICLISPRVERIYEK